MKKTTNVIYELIKAQEAKIEYVDLDKAANDAYLYLIDCHCKSMPFSEIILNMPGQLGYVLHPQSFVIGWELFVDRVPEDMKQQSIGFLKSSDDVGFFEKNSSELIPTSMF